MCRLNINKCYSCKRREIQTLTQLRFSFERAKVEEQRPDRVDGGHKVEIN
jgi:hypothetical protein